MSKARDRVDVIIISKRIYEISVYFLNIFYDYINYYYSFSDIPCEEKQSTQRHCRAFNNGDWSDGWKTVLYITDAATEHNPSLRRD